MTEEIKKQVIEEIHEYLKENIEDFELEAQLALRKMDRCRAPLDNINSCLSREIEDKMEEWLHNEIETDELLAVEKSSKEGPSIFDMINGLSKFADRIKELAEKVREDRPDVAGYLDGAHSGIGKAYIDLNTYLEKL